MGVSYALISIGKEKSKTKSAGETMYNSERLSNATTL